MTPPDGTGMNFATDSAHIDIQAGIVHGDVYYYTTPPDPTPREKFKAGMRYLEGLMPGQAWQLINDAVISGYRTNQVCFYWLLALLSGRTRHELSARRRPASGTPTACFRSPATTPGRTACGPSADCWTPPRNLTRTFAS
jgi:hypothetical protein